MRAGRIVGCPGTAGNAQGQAEDEGRQIYSDVHPCILTLHCGVQFLSADETVAHL